MSASVNDGNLARKRKPAGRPPGRSNDATITTKKSAAYGIAMMQRMQITPLRLLLGVVNNEPEFRKVSVRRFQAAIAAAPYCHARLAAVAFVPPADTTGQQRRQALAGLNYQQRKQIEQILLSTSGVIDGDPLSTQETDDEQSTDE